MSANNLPRNRSRTRSLTFSPVQLHPMVKSFRLTSKRIQPCSTKCTMAGSCLGWEGASPRKTRGFWLVGVISDLMSTVVSVAAANLFSSLPTLKPGLAASLCLPVAISHRDLAPRWFRSLICHACFFWSLAKRLILCSTVTWARFVVSQAVARKRQLDGAGWCCTVAQLACVSQDGR